MIPFAGHTENTGHFLQPTAMATGRSSYRDLHGRNPTRTLPRVRAALPCPRHQRHEALVHIAARPGEDVDAVVEAASPALEVADLDHLLRGRSELGPRSRWSRAALRERQLLRRRQAVRAEVAAIGDAQLDARELRACLPGAMASRFTTSTTTRGAARPRAGMQRCALAHLGDLLERRIGTPMRRSAPTSTSPSCGASPSSTCRRRGPVVLLVPLGERDQVLAVEARVDVDEGSSSRPIWVKGPKLDHVRERAALVVGVSVRSPFNGLSGA